jgi:hypothetical protein
MVTESEKRESAQMNEQWRVPQVPILGPGIVPFSLYRLSVKITSTVVSTSTGWPSSR